MKHVFSQTRETVLIVPQNYQELLPNAWAQWVARQEFGLTVVINAQTLLTNSSTGITMVSQIKSAFRLYSSSIPFGGSIRNLLGMCQLVCLKESKKNLAAHGINSLYKTLKAWKKLQGIEQLKKLGEDVSEKVSHWAYLSRAPEQELESQYDDDDEVPYTDKMVLSYVHNHTKITYRVVPVKEDQEWARVVNDLKEVKPEFKFLWLYANASLNTTLADISLNINGDIRKSFASPFCERNIKALPKEGIIGFLLELFEPGVDGFAVVFANLPTQVRFIHEVSFHLGRIYFSLLI
jgi:hypothetical protein